MKTHSPAARGCVCEGGETGVVVVVALREAAL